MKDGMRRTNLLFSNLTTFCSIDNNNGLKTIDGSSVSFDRKSPVESTSLVSTKKRDDEKRYTSNV